MKRIKKDIHVEDALRSAKMLNEARIIPQYAFIIGFPDEKRDEIMETLKLTQKMREICPDMIGGIGAFRPYPKCELCEYLIKKGEFEEPKKLRDWTDGEIIKVYTDIDYPKKWQVDQKLIDNGIFFARLTLLMGNGELKKNILGGNLKYLFFALFRKIASIRLKKGIFGFPIDRKIYQTAEKALKKLK